jgi:uncharacterized membrane protein
MEKKNKYDTNPLDPNVAKRTDEVWGAKPKSANTEEMTGATREIGRSANERAKQDEGSEAPTRRYDNPPQPSSYPSVFIPPTYPPPASYGATAAPQPQPPPHVAQPLASSAVQPPSSRTLPGLGLPENVAVILPYLPIPMISGAAAVVELMLVPRNEVRARFHAAQGLALHLFVLAVSFLFRIAYHTTGNLFSAMLWIAWTVFTLAAFIFFIISIVRVARGEPHRIEPLGEATKWLNEKIEPRK